MHHTLPFHDFIAMIGGASVALYIALYYALKLIGSQLVKCDEEQFHHEKEEDNQ